MVPGRSSPTKWTHGSIKKTNKENWNHLQWKFSVQPWHKWNIPLKAILIKEQTLVYQADMPRDIPRAFGGKRSLIYVSVGVDNGVAVGEAGCHRASPTPVSKCYGLRRPKCNRNIWDDTVLTEKQEIKIPLQTPHSHLKVQGEFEMHSRCTPARDDRSLCSRDDVPLNLSMASKCLPLAVGSNGTSPWPGQPVIGASEPGV